MRPPTDEQLDAIAAEVRVTLDRLVTQIIPEDDPAHVRFDDFDRKREWYEARKIRRGKGREALAPRGKGRSVGAILAEIRYGERL